MTNAATRGDRLVDPPAHATPGVAPPPRLRRRPALVAGAVVAICLGALLGAWAWTATTSTQEVLAARNTIPRGAVITTDDLERVRVSSDPALAPIDAASYDQIIGQRAALDIAAGTLITEESTSNALLPPEGMSVVGVALTPAQVPGLPLQSGDRVRLVVTPGEGERAPTGSPTFSEAEVVGSHTDESTGELIVDLLIAYADATTLAARVATRNVALVLDSGEQ